MLISILQYPTSISLTPPRVVKEFRKTVTQFVWNSKKPKVSYNSIIQNTHSGGLGLLEYYTDLR